MIHSCATNSKPNDFFILFQGDNDFKLEEFLAGTPETFEPHYGKDKGLYYNLLQFQLKSKAGLPCNKPCGFSPDQDFTPFSVA